MTPAKKTTTTPDMGEKKKEYKYQQEISQMVRARTRSRARSPSHLSLVTCLQMFVFGEIQEPLTDTVNLVENIIRSQLVELVCFASCTFG
jgi:transcription initiation protein SPT3